MAKRSFEVTVRLKLDTLDHEGHPATVPPDCADAENAVVVALQLLVQDGYSEPLISVDEYAILRVEMHSEE